MPHLSQKAVHRPGTRYSLYAGEVTGQLLVQNAKTLNLKRNKCFLMTRCTKKQLMESPMQYPEEQILNWKFMGWKVFQRKTWRRDEGFWSKKTKVLYHFSKITEQFNQPYALRGLFIPLFFLCSDTQKRKLNQDDSDEEDDDDEPGSSFQQPVARLPQAGFVPPMTQPGFLPVRGAPGIPPAGYSGIPPMIPGVPPMMPGLPHGVPGMPPGIMPVGGMMPPMMPGMPAVIHPSVSHRPGITHMPQVPSVNVLTRPAVPAVITPSAQPDITKPLFPSAGQSQQTVSGSPHTPPSTTSDTPKPTFPAYTQSSAAVASPNADSSTVSKPPSTLTSKAATLTTTSATSKLIHPDEDLSLEELRAQLPRYQCSIRQNTPTAPSVGPAAVLPPQQLPVGNPIPGQFSGPLRGLPGYVPGQMLPFVQAHAGIPPGYQGAPSRPPMGVRPPVMSPGGRY
uniref:Zinc finger protein 207, a n=1 Tax=Oryzias latipes TaxID=8090 RepID=A0A3P9HBD6_ORYLA